MVRCSAGWVLVAAALAALVVFALTDDKKRRGRKEPGFERLEDVREEGAGTGTIDGPSARTEETPAGSGEAGAALQVTTRAESL